MKYTSNPYSARFPTRLSEGAKLFNLKIFLRHLIAGTFILTFTLASHAQSPSKKEAANSWPTQTLRIVVGFQAGSSPDMLARAIAEGLSKKIGKPVIVENKSGAAGNIAVDIVTKAKDGHTIGLGPNGPLTSSTFLFPKLPYDPISDLQPISLVASTPLVLVVPASVPANTLAEYLIYGRGKGGALNYGSVGTGSASHLVMELFKEKTGLKPAHIPFPGFPAVTTAMLSGQIDIAFMVASVAYPHVKSGRLKILGSSAASRSLILPDIDPIAKTANLANFDAEVWNGVYGPRSMPPAVATKLSVAINEVLREPTTRTALFEQSWQVVAGSPEALAQRMHTDTGLWGGLIRRSGIRLE